MYNIVPCALFAHTICILYWLRLIQRGAYNIIIIITILASVRTRKHVSPVARNNITNSIKNTHTDRNPFGYIKNRLRYCCVPADIVGRLFAETENPRQRRKTYPVLHISTVTACRVLYLYVFWRSPKL